MSEEQALRAIGEEMGLDFIDLAETKIDDSLLGLFPHRLLHRHSLLPVRMENGSLVVATAIRSTCTRWTNSRPRPVCR